MKIFQDQLTVGAGRRLFGLAGPIVLFAMLIMKPVGSLQECILTFEPEVVMAGGGMTEISFTPSVAVEGVTAVTFEDVSGLSGTLADASRLEIDLSDATAGSWQVVLLAGPTQICAGTLTVSGGA
jgi:hypothetical protein